MTNNPKATHPAREAGQRWHSRDDSQDYGERTLTGERRGNCWMLSKPDEAGNVGWSDDRWASSAFTMTLLSPATDAETRCHPDCGKTVYEYEASPHSSFSKLGYWRVVVGDLRFCSKACADARVPPLPVAPVTTGAKRVDHSMCGTGCGAPECMPAPKPPLGPKPVANDLGAGALSVADPSRKAAKANPAPVPVTPRCGNNGCDTPFQNVAQRYCISLDENGNRGGVDLELSCEPCHRMDEIEFAERTGAQSGTPCASLPGLMPKRPMSFSPMDDSCLEDC